jgi:hypothetical protein
MNLDANRISRQLSNISRNIRPVAALDSSAVSRRIGEAIARRQPRITAGSAEKHLVELHGKLAGRKRSLKRER